MLPSLGKTLSECIQAKKKKKSVMYSIWIFSLQFTNSCTQVGSGSCVSQIGDTPNRSLPARNPRSLARNPRSASLEEGDPGRTPQDLQEKSTLRPKGQGHTRKIKPGADATWETLAFQRISDSDAPYSGILWESGWSQGFSRITPWPEATVPLYWVKALVYI